MSYPKNRKSRIIDITGKKYNSLCAVKFEGVKNHAAMWTFRCECGVEKIWNAAQVKCGDIKNCGCAISKRGVNLITHGLFKKYRKEYFVYKDMIRRCADQRVKAYKNYGGRGITVSERWMKFENFVEDMGHRPSAIHTLERNDNDAGYSKENCSWELREVQNNNRRDSVRVEWCGKTQTITQWAKEIGIGVGTLYSRIRLANWPLERAFVKENNIHIRIRK